MSKLLLGRNGRLVKVAAIYLGGALPIGALAVGAGVPWEVVLFVQTVAAFVFAAVVDLLGAVQ